MNKILSHFNCYAFNGLFSFRDVESRLTANQIHNIEINIDRLEDLFDDPEFSVESKVFGQNSGLDQIKKLVLSEGFGAKFKFSIHISRPPNLSADGILAVLKSYCRNKIRANESEIHATKREGRVYLVFSLVWILIMLLIYFSLLLIGLPPSSNLGIFIAQFFILAGWVLVWRPIETLAYDWRPFRRENYVYKKILDSPVKFSSGTQFAEREG